AFNQAINLGCQKALVFNRKGISLLNLGAIDAAITSLKRACDIEPTVAEYQAYLGLGLAHSGRNKEAMSIYEKALSLNKDDAKTWFYYGCALYNSGNLELSLDALEKALSISPSLSKTWSLKGDIHCIKEDYQEALKAYDRSLESHVSFEVMQKKVYVLGTCLGRSDEVIEMYKSSLGLVEELLEKESVNVKFLHQKGYTLALMQRHEEARDIFIDILKLDPCHAYAWYNLACCYVSQEQIKLALDALSWAIANEPIALSKSAKTDDSFEAIRESPAFQELVPS
ncbi:MAG: tetratricopeptide repeat protein, partial [Cyanobacteria bacterium P01_D01_bin.123]